ncbi:PAS domain S-box protein [Nostoc piscinale]|uniref:PAS domain S-box protein n=1 Tax=Nostoc piscinale TaxID=224012 RepID=UPI000B280A96|nr:PAS domain S-box protein [Nostoc piscinale]
MSKKNLVGILTLRDVVRLIGAGVDLSRVKISDVMTQPVISLTRAAAQNALTALTFMRQHHIRHLAVVDEQGQLLGLITQDRIRQVIQPAHLLKLRCVAEVMVREVIHALPTISVLELSQMMSDRRISCVVIVAPQPTKLIPVGIITEKDILKLQLQGLDMAQTQVQAVMSTPVLSVSPSESLWTVHQLMQEQGIKRVVVIDEQGELQGLVTQTNLLQVFDPLEIVNVIQALQTKVEEQTVQLRQTNQQLEAQIKQHQQVEESLRQVQQELELRVVERTAELVQANARLRRREQQLQALFDHALDAILIANDEGRYVDVNAAACELFGVSREELLGSTIADFAAPEFNFTQAWQQFREQEQMSGEFQLHRPNGTVRATEFAAVANFIPHRHLSIIRDVSDRQQAKANLQNSEQRLQLALSASNTGMWDWNLQTNEVVWSESMCSLFDIDPQTFNNRFESFVNFIHPEDREFVEQHLKQSIDQHTNCNIEFRVVWLNGTVHWVHGKGSVFYDETGQPLRMIGVHQDITERQQAKANLQKSEQRLKLALWAGNTGTWDWDLQTNEVIWSDHLFSLFGLTPDTFDVSYENFLNQIVHPEDRERLHQSVLRAIDQQVPHDIEFRFLYPDGTVGWSLCKGQVLYSKTTGEPLQMIGVNMDITEKKQLEFNLQQSEAKLRDILNSSAISIARLRLFANLDWEYDYQSAGCEGIFGYTQQEMMDKYCWRSRVFPEDLENIFMPALENLLAETTVTVQYRFYHKNGSVRWISGTFTSRYDEVANCWIVTVADTDITERKQAQEKIQEQAALIDIATDAIFVHDLANRILFWSRGAENLYGWTAEETVGKLAHEIFYRESLSQLEVGLQTTIEQGAWQGELEQVTKSGREIIVASRWTLVNNQFGEPQSILVVNTDITEKKQLEQQFYRAQRLESIGTLASGIAHDLNNVFAPIVMIAQLLPSRCKNVDTRTQELFKTLETSSKRGSDLVKQILTFARGTEGQRILLQPGHLLKELAKVIQQTFPKSIEIITDIPTNTLWMVYADPTQLEQVFMNLAVNARDAMPNGGKLTITAANRVIDSTYARMHLESKAGDYIVVTISDTGTGIPPEILERIFDPFFTTKEVGKGTGLGLSTVLGIVKNHGGFVEVASQVGQGTEFQVFLLRGEGTATESIAKTELPRGNGELILVVDDETIVQQTVQEALADYNYKILIANDGIEAIALYVEYQPEISAVLLDMVMPNMDGLTAIRTLRTINPNVKIVATSGLPANEQKAIAAGADKFLSKPYTTTDLLTTLSNVIRLKE